MRKQSHGKYVMLVLDNGLRILEHRFVIQESIGRTLKRDEVVHHKDGNGKNNDISNLELMKLAEHSAMHSHENGNGPVECICPNCGDLFSVERRKFNQSTKNNKMIFCSRKCIGLYGFKSNVSGGISTYEQYLNDNPDHSISDAMIYMNCSKGTISIWRRNLGITRKYTKPSRTTGSSSEFDSEGSRFES